MAALWLMPGPFGDQLTLRPVTVLAVSNGMAKVRIREAYRIQHRLAKVTDLASTPERAVEKLQAQMGRLLKMGPDTVIAALGALAYVEEPARAPETLSFLQRSLTGGEAIVKTEAVTA
jgi:hypothetical protein